ncbi:hypothetical protein BC936DRAFT_148991 [Jimgerdemannia flammicorona]|uniref:Uncharacterized protein n=1 Tax=Jimgerdemannia flammicorona TaxID=994334 RepID=A0A433DKD1_9FUNG|nr:hypothetical protein BC936DRAFT_148991 [Jimgerdemannia flammicorona]
MKFFALALIFALLAIAHAVSLGHRDEHSDVIEWIDQEFHDIILLPFELPNGEQKIAILFDGVLAGSIVYDEKSGNIIVYDPYDHIIPESELESGINWHNKRAGPPLALLARLAKFTLKWGARAFILGCLNSGFDCMGGINCDGISFKTCAQNATST